MAKSLLTLEIYLMGRDKLYPLEVTAEVLDNAKILIQRVNKLLTELKIDDIKISSGWRPAVVNSATPNAAKKSNHMLGAAVDLVDDKNQSLCNKLKTDTSLLERHQLWMEDPDSTKGKYTNWTHLQIFPPKSKKLIFKP